MRSERFKLSAASVVALLVVYFVWGSTYLAIRVAIETLPGFTMAGVRFLIAGVLLYGWGRLSGGVPPSGAQWRTSALIGGLLLLGGNGLVVWSEYRISSGVAALVVAVEPVWIALLAPLIVGSRRASWRTAVGLAFGVAGVAALVLDPSGSDPTRADPWGALGVVAATISWALGSVLSVKADFPRSRAVAYGAQMLAGGALLLAAGAFTDDWTTIDPESFSLRSIEAFVYLILLGSIAGFTAYGYLLKATPPLVASTYAFVNPLVAVALGWLFANEPVGPRLAIATFFILGAVALIFRDELAAKKAGDPGEREREEPAGTVGDGAPERAA